MKKKIDNRRYSQEPKCRRCQHPKVVHRGERHILECSGVGCFCDQFIGVAE